jgi:hypothetical protein
MAVKLSALSAGHTFTPRKIPGTHFCLKLRAPGRLEELGQLKISIDLIENRIRDLPACSIEPQPTTFPRAPQYNNDEYSLLRVLKIWLKLDVFLIKHY